MIMLAHADGSLHGDFFAGLLHPLTAVEHLLPLLGLSLLAAIQTPRAACWMLLILPAGLFAGTMLHAWFGAPGWTPWFNLAAFSVVGLRVAFAPRVAPPAIATIGAVLGITIALEIGLGLPAAPAMSFRVGVAAAGALSVAIVVAAVRSVRRNAVTARAAG